MKKDNKKLFNVLRINFEAMVEFEDTYSMEEGKEKYNEEGCKRLLKKVKEDVESFLNEQVEEDCYQINIDSTTSFGEVTFRRRKSESKIENEETE